MHEMLEIVKVFLSLVEIFFIAYLLIYSTYLFLSAVVGSIVLYRNRYLAIMHNEIKHDFYVPVSIIVPAYNEELTLIDTIQSLLNLDYKLYEIIVVNDGSTDATKDNVIKYFNLHEVKKPIRRQIACTKERKIYESRDYKVPITFIDKPNGGKADALNMGINASSYPYFIGMDADSVLQKDSLEKIVKPILENDNVVACGGLIRLSNGIKLEKGKVVKYRVSNNPLVAMQVLEYDRSFLASRILFDQFNGNLIISGAFGLFKKDLVVTVGGYDRNTVGEDFELVTKLHTFCKKHGIDYSIPYVSDAICWTQGPSNLKGLIKQRKRWYIGLFQCMTKYRELLLKHQYGLLSYVSYFYFLVYELLSPYIEIFGILSMVIAYQFDLLNVPFMILFFIIYAAFGGLLSLTTFLARVHDQKYNISFFDFIKAFFASIFEIIILRNILTIARFLALIRYRSNKNKWQKIERKKINYQ